MQVLHTIKSVREVVAAARGAGKSVGFVPTMGALHQGHKSLIETACEDCDFVVVSVFVNPTQFGPGEDFEKYPKSLESDSKVCEAAGADVVFAPSVGEMYPRENLTWVNLEKLTEPLCGRSRKGHFRGVATVCTKLFNIVGCDRAFFGQKDAQQAVVIKRMVSDLNIPLEIVVCPTVRQANGLAVSSRNQYLSESEKQEATGIWRSLERCRDLIKGGECESSKIIAEMRIILDQIQGGSVEYIEIVDFENLEAVKEVKGKVLAAVAVKLGAARLIDNIVVDCED